MKAIFTKPKTYTRVKELQLWDVALLHLLYLLFYYFDVGAMKKQDRPTRRYVFYFQDMTPPCWYMEFKQHEVVVIWCYHITGVLHFILFQVLMFHLVIFILAFLHLRFTIKVSLCVITRCFGTRLQWIKYNLDLPLSIKVSKF